MTRGNLTRMQSKAKALQAKIKTFASKEQNQERKSKLLAAYLISGQLADIFSMLISDSAASEFINAAKKTKYTI